MPSPPQTVLLGSTYMARGVVFEIHDLRSWSLGFTGSGEGEVTTITVANDAVARTGQLTNLRDSDWLNEIFGEGCEGIRVIDLNESEGAQLEFGRYRLEVLFKRGSVVWPSVADACETRGR